MVISTVVRMFNGFSPKSEMIDQRTHFQIGEPPPFSIYVLINRDVAPSRSHFPMIWSLKALADSRSKVEPTQIVLKLRKKRPLAVAVVKGCLSDATYLSLKAGNTKEFMTY